MCKSEQQGTMVAANTRQVRDLPEHFFWLKKQDEVTWTCMADTNHNVSGPQSMMAAVHLGGSGVLRRWYHLEVMEGDAGILKKEWWPLMTANSEAEEGILGTQSVRAKGTKLHVCLENNQDKFAWHWALETSEMVRDKACRQEGQDLELIKWVDAGFEFKFLSVMNMTIESASCQILNALAISIGYFSPSTHKAKMRQERVQKHL